jgi:aquaporin Z
MKSIHKEELDSAQKKRMVEKSSSLDFLDSAFEGRRIFAEFWGTFLTVAFAAGGGMIIAISNGGITLAMAMVARGLIVMCTIYFMGTMSGAHLNPAVTLAFALRRNFPWSRVAGYIIAQAIGSIVAILFLKFMFGTVAHLGASMPGNGISTGKALAMEIFLTAGLINTILGTASGARNIGTNGAIAVGSYIILAGLWAYPISGASMNPIRSLAPDLIRGDFSTSWIYVLGPLLGALIGVLFERILIGKSTTAGSIAAQGTLGMDD